MYSMDSRWGWGKRWVDQWLTIGRDFSMQITKASLIDATSRINVQFPGSLKH